MKQSNDTRDRRARGVAFGMTLGLALASVACGSDKNSSDVSSGGNSAGGNASGGNASGGNAGGNSVAGGSAGAPSAGSSSSSSGGPSGGSGGHAGSAGGLGTASAGTSSGGMTASAGAAGSSATCTPSCTNKQCGDDGCNGTCGTCNATQACSAAGMCAAPAGGAAFTVDAKSGLTAISSAIYGLAFAEAKSLGVAGLQRFGGDCSSMYNWKTDAFNCGEDYIFANQPLVGFGYPPHNLSGIPAGMTGADWLVTFDKQHQGRHSDDRADDRLGCQRQYERW